MASRRTRIKGIANIPQRRKPNDSVEPSKDIEDKVTDSNLTSVTAVTVTDVTNDSSQLDPKSEAIDTPPKNEPEQKNPTILRRKFIKPPVAINNINRKPKINDEIENTNASVEDPQQPITKPTSNKIVVINEQIIRPANVEIVRATSPQKQPHVFNTLDILSNETHFMPNGNNTSRVEMLPNDRGTPKPSFIHTPTTPESEYPPPPPSPSKINRSRIKAIPRLSQRKTSFSASESEDESRRHFNRNRNDSVCSTTSTTADIPSVSECLSPQRPGREFSSVIREKCKKKVHSRKLAEARRQFNLKYFGSNPDRQKLTMIDLIFYNPTTNPMKNSAEKPKTEEETEKVVEEEVDNPSVEEVVDDPVEDENEGKSDEENEMPVPQMKVGPHGEIILDEKSLIIEKKEVRKAREEIQKSRIIEGDFDTGYGVYKRAKRSKDWSSTETLRFYKALNIIGTDFSLMCELFPKRNRRELKLKFKKEEKINKNLIDKALMNPCEFEFRELKAEVDIEEKELEMLEKQKAEEFRLKKEKSEKLLKTRKAMRIPAKEPINEIHLTEREPKAKKRKPKKGKRLDIMSVTEMSDLDESNVESESELELEIINPPKRTRYGRIPKVQREIDWETREQMMKVSKITRLPRKSINEESQSEQLEAGSLMIIPTGNSEFKILMVTPDGSTTPVNLNNDAISKVMDYNKHKAPSVESVLKISAEIDNVECNVTIPATDDKTT